MALGLLPRQLRAHHNTLARLAAIIIRVVLHRARYIDRPRARELVHGELVLSRSQPLEGALAAHLARLDLGPARALEDRGGAAAARVREVSVFRARDRRRLERVVVAQAAVDGHQGRQAAADEGHVDLDYGRHGRDHELFWGI